MTESEYSKIMGKLHELDKKNEIYQTSTIEQLKGINNHLADLNGKVARNVERIGEHDKDLALLRQEFSTAYAKVHDWDVEARESRKYWYRKVTWAVIVSVSSLLIAGLVASGTLTL